MIKKLLELGYTEQAIAMEAKVHQSTISRILTGKTIEPKYSLICKIKKIFAVYGVAV